MYTGKATRRIENEGQSTGMWVRKGGILILAHVKRRLENGFTPCSKFSL